MTADKARMMVAIAKFGPIHPITQADIAIIESLQSAGYVAKDPNNPEWSLTARGWAFLRKGPGKRG
jgi:hypothetical protein